MSLMSFVCHMTAHTHKWSVCHMTLTPLFSRSRDDHMVTTLSKSQALSTQFMTVCKILLNHTKRFTDFDTKLVKKVVDRCICDLSLGISALTRTILMPSFVVTAYRQYPTSSLLSTT